MIKFTKFEHICIIVDNIEEATEFYKDLFGAIPFLNFPKLKNIGFAKGAGFLEHPDKVEATLRLLKLPTQDNMLIELFEYHNPKGKFVINHKEASDRNLVAHIALGI